MVRDLLANSDVCYDFLSIVTGQDKVTFTKQKTINESLSLESLSLHKELHKQWADVGTPMRRAVSWRLQAMLNAHENKEKATRVSIHKGLANKVFKSYKADAIALDEAFFEGTPMYDALQDGVKKAIRGPQTIDPRHHFSKEELGRMKALFAVLIETCQMDKQKLTHHLREMRIKDIR
jgi:hypothetical protein